MQELKNMGAYIEKVCEQIRWKKAHDCISRELSAHMEDRKSALMKKGQSEEEAEENAVLDMGDAVVTGQQLDAEHRPKPDWAIVSLIGLCVVAGLAIQFITSYGSGLDSGFAYATAFARTMIALPVGIAVFLAVYFIDYTVMVRHSVVIFVLLMVLCQIATVATSAEIGLYQQHIIYIALVLCPVYAAIVYRFRGKSYNGILILGLFAGVALLSFAYVQSYMPCFVFAISSLVIITAAIIKDWFSVQKWKALAIVYIPTLVSLGYALFGMQSYISLRGRGILLSPFVQANPLEEGYVQSIIRDFILPNAKLFGGSTTIITNGHEMQLQYLLPSWWSDYSIAYIVHRFGYICAIGVIAIVLLLLVRMLIATFRQTSEIGFIVCLSVTVTLFIQSFFYILTNLGYFVAISGPLPFITYGGASLVTNMFLAGIFLSAYRNKTIINDIKVLTKIGQ